MLGLSQRSGPPSGCVHVISAAARRIPDEVTLGMSRDELERSSWFATAPMCARLRFSAFEASLPEAADLQPERASRADASALRQTLDNQHRGSTSRGVGSVVRPQRLVPRLALVV